MESFLYSFFLKIRKTSYFRWGIWAIVFNFISMPLFAQMQPRGVFLSDQIQNQDSTSFREGTDGEFIPEEQEEYLNLGSQAGRSRGSAAVLSDRALIYQVHVLGEVKRPGTYRISPSMRVTDALQLSGNIKSMGSERFVQLRKAGQRGGRTLDLFAYKTFGELSQNPYLQDNDTIYVPLKKRAIEIEGPVRRPGIFELRGENSLQDVLNLAGGYTVGVNPQEAIKIVRYSTGVDKEIISVVQDTSDLRTFQVRDGDIIVVPHKFWVNREFDYNVKKLPNDNVFYPAHEDRVFVIGAVRGPGAFDFNRHYSLRQYLTLAGGTTTMAKNGKIKVVTVDGKTYKAKNANYERLINPGDTVIVPEKSIPTSFYIGLLPTIASLGLSAVALFK